MMLARESIAIRRAGELDGDHLSFLEEGLDGPVDGRDPEARAWGLAARRSSWGESGVGVGPKTFRIARRCGVLRSTCEVSRDRVPGQQRMANFIPVLRNLKGDEMNARSSGAAIRMDGVGATLSFACAVHCLAMPLLMGILPLLGMEFFADEKMEIGLLLGALGIASFNAVNGVRSHGRRVILLAFGGAAAMMIASHLLEGRVHHLLAGLGGLILCATHLMNRRWCRRCCDSCVGDVEEAQVKEAL